MSNNKIRNAEKYVTDMINVAVALGADRSEADDELTKVLFLEEDIISLNKKNRLFVELVPNNTRKNLL